jgi:ureidoglycolate hydrolase
MYRQSHLSERTEGSWVVHVIEKEVRATDLTKQSFEKFGTIIGAQSGKPTATMDILDWWDAIAELGIEDPTSGYLVTRKRDFTLDKMERHSSTQEVCVPLEGVSLLPLAEPRDSTLEEISAFILDGSKAVVLRKGVWHWAPYPVSETASFVLVLKRNTGKEDMEIKDLSTKVRIVI